MGWPISQDYNEAIQNPVTSFAEPALQRGEVVTGPLGLPLPRSGNFADVYQMVGADGRKWAIKCFTRQVPGLQERYAKIDAHLQKAQLPFTVGFQFLPQGMRVRGQWFPILKMEWVEGITLNEFVRQYADKPVYLRALLGLWLKLSTRLRDAQIAHADLQHGNVLLVPGASANKLNLKLIDYDGMWVPALRRTPSGEAGHPAYQHPWRLQERAYSADVDRFPHLVIACALRATALGGKPLWNTFDNGDNLLFRESDLANPRQSAVMRALWDMDDPTVTNLLALLVLAAQRPLSDTPWLDEVLVGETTTAVSDGLLAKAADVIGVPRRAVRQAMPTAQLYVTPEQANEVATAYEEMATAPLPRYMQRRSKMPLLGGVIAGLVLLVAVVVILALRRDGNGKNDPNPPIAKKNDNDPNPPPKPVERPAKIDANWPKIEAGPPIAIAPALPNSDEEGTGRLVRSVPNRSAGLAIAFNATANQVVLAGRDVLSVSDHTGETEPLTFGADQGPFSHAAIAPDLTYIVTVSQDRMVCCWKIATRTLEWNILFPDRVTALAISPDARRVALSGVGVGYIEYGITTHKELRRHPQIQAHEMHFTRDGEKLLLRVHDQLEWWELDEPERKGTLSAGFDVRACGISGNGRELWAGGKANEIKRWNALTLQPLADYIPGVITDVRGIEPLMRPTGFLLRHQAGVNVCFDQNKATAPDVIPTPLGQVASIFITADQQTALLGNEKGFVVARIGEMKAVVKKNPPSPIRVLKSLPVDRQPTRVGFDAAGKYVYAVFATKVTVSDTATGSVLGTYNAKGPIQSVGFSHDEQLLVTEGAGDEAQTTLYAWKTKQEAKLLPTAPEPLLDLRGVPHETKANFVLATSAKRGQLLFDTQTQKPVAKWPDAQGIIKLAVPLLDGQFIAYAYQQAPVRLWSVDTQETYRTMEGSEGVLALDTTPDGKKLVGLFPLGRLLMWDIENGKIDQDVAHDATGPFTGVRVLGKNVALLQRPDEPVLIHLDTGKSLDATKAPHPWGSHHALYPSKEWLLHSTAKSVDLWTYSAKALAELPELPTPPPANPDLVLVRDGPTAPLAGAAYSVDGGKLLVVTTTGRVQRYETETLKLEREVSATETDIRSMIRSGTRFFTFGSKGEIRRWDVDKLDIGATYLVGAEPVVMAVKPDSDQVFLTTVDNKLHSIDLSRRKTSATNVNQPQHPSGGRMARPLANVAYFGNATSAIVRWDDGLIGIWNPGNARVTKLLIDDGAKDKVALSCLATTPTGRYAIIGTKNGYVRWWDTTKLEKARSEFVHRVEGKTDCITDVVINEKGERCLTRGIDGRIILWDVTTFKKLKEYTSTPGPGRLCIAPDDSRFLLLLAGRIEQWKLP